MSVGGFFKKLGKGALKVAPFAAPFIPGVGPVLAPLLGAAAGGTSAAINHKGLGGILGGAGIGAGEGFGTEFAQQHIPGLPGGPARGGFSDLPPDISKTIFGGAGGSGGPTNISEIIAAATGTGGKGILGQIGDALKNPYVDMILASAIQGAFQHKPQEKIPYEGDMSAQNTLQRAYDQITPATAGVKRRIGQGITLPSAFAQQPPMFMGGDLPMSIGVTGVDPALSNPNLLHLGGVDVGEGADAEPDSDADEARQAIDLYNKQRGF